MRTLDDRVKQVHEAYELQILELRRQQARCTIVAKQVATRHGMKKAKWMLAQWAEDIRARLSC